MANVSSKKRNEINEFFTLPVCLTAAELMGAARTGSEEDIAEAFQRLCENLSGVAQLCGYREEATVLDDLAHDGFGG